MKVRLLKKSTIEDFMDEHPQSRRVFTEWLDKLQTADWKIPTDMRTTFVTADFLGNGSQRVVFDVGGGNYRIICGYEFGISRVHLFICWIGSHTEYDKINKAGKQYTVKIF